MYIITDLQSEDSTEGSYSSLWTVVTSFCSLSGVFVLYTTSCYKLNVIYIKHDIIMPALKSYLNFTSIKGM